MRDSTCNLELLQLWRHVSLAKLRVLSHFLPFVPSLGRQITIFPLACLEPDRASRQLVTRKPSKVLLKCREEGESRASVIAAGSLFNRSPFEHSTLSSDRTSFLSDIERSVCISRVFILRVKKKKKGNPSPGGIM